MIKQEDNNDRQLVAKLTSGRAGQMKSYVAVLLVSVGKENFEEEAIESAVKMINQEFKACCVAVADTLQRHNIATEKEISNKEAYAESLIKGDEWIQRNTPYFVNGFSIPYEIIRWDGLINDPDFVQKEKKFSSCIAENTSLSTAMKESIDEYGKRLLKHLGEEHFERIAFFHENNCFSYLKEECIALTILPKKISFDNNELNPYVIVYPGKSTLILTENREVFIKNEFHDVLQNYSDFLNWIPYRFNRIKKYDNSCYLANSLKSKKDLVEIEDKFLILKQVDFINNLAEAQLESMGDLFNEQMLLEFKHYLLDFFLNSELFSFELKSLLTSGKSFSIQSLAYVFGTQLLAIFNKLEKKFSNKCKANMIRILKREHKGSVNAEKQIDCSMAMFE